MSLATRALIAVALTVAFYVLAIAIGLALAVGVPALEVSSHHGNIWATIGAVGAGVTILRAIIPERSAFTPPGPELTGTDQPELHALLTEVAFEAGETAADHVYLDLDVNAAVLEHRRRRVLLLGLPLLATLDTDELRAVVAHEYGHYRSGDTRFGAWIWRTRAAVLKTVHQLAATSSNFRRVVRVPFDAYAKLFLRITNSISRRAEFVADQVSASVAGPDAAGRALRRLVAVSGAYDAYWHSDVVPMLEARRRPPLSGGLAAMTAHADLAGSLDELVKSDIDSREPDPYASHPTLRQRLQALGVEVDGAAPPPAEIPATSLLRDLPALEHDLLRTCFGDEVAAFEPADWNDAGAIHLARLRTFLEPYRGVVAGDWTVGDAALLAAQPPLPLLSAVRGRVEVSTDDDEARHRAANVVAGLVVSAAVDAGATVSAKPGESLMIVLDGVGSLNVWSALGPVAKDPAAAARWAEHPVVVALRDRSL
jgi:Zn-dependent protease with chaperone function